MNAAKALGQKRNTLIDVLLAEDPALPHLTAAKLLHASRPDLFATVEHARSAVRSRTGNNGNAQRHDLESAHGHQFREPFTGKSLPIPTVLRDDTPFVFDTERCLVMGDLHIPFHEPDAIKTAIRYARKRGCRDVLLLGDVNDHYQCASYFDRDPETATLTESLDKAGEFWAWLRRQFPTGRIVFKYGNHDERWAIKAHRTLPEAGKILDGICEFYTKLPELGIEVVKDRRFIHMGYVTAVHGHELGRAQYNPVSPARGLLLRAKECSMTAHWHQSTVQRGRTIRDHQIVSYSIGCMCDLHPAYMPVNDWQIGLAIFTRTDQDGGFLMENKVIIGGMVV